MVSRFRLSPIDQRTLGVAWPDELVRASDYDALAAELADALIQGVKSDNRVRGMETMIASWLHDGRMQTFEDRERIRAEMRACLASETGVAK